MRKTVDVAEGQCEKRAGCSGVGESPKRKGTPVQDLVELLKNNPYPGRGIVVGKDTVYYFIMGRSVNSRNRIFATEPDGIRTEAHDPALLEDPSLIIYHPVRTMGDALVVTNGDQTDTIVEAGDDGVTYDILYDILIKQTGEIHSDWTGVKLDVDAYRKVVYEPYDLRVREGTIDF